MSQPAARTAARITGHKAECPRRWINSWTYLALCGRKNSSSAASACKRHRRAASSIAKQLKDRERACGRKARSILIPQTSGSVLADIRMAQASSAQTFLESLRRRCFLPDDEGIVVTRSALRTPSGSRATRSRAASRLWSTFIARALTPILLIACLAPLGSIRISAVVPSAAFCRSLRQ
jgi:hypothetical protein